MIIVMIFVNRKVINTELITTRIRIFKNVGRRQKYYD